VQHTSVHSFATIEGFLRVSTSPPTKDDEDNFNILECTTAPFTLVFEKTVVGNSIWKFAISMVWLCLQSYAVLEIAVKVSNVWKISSSTAGLTLLAWGGQIPDLLAAVSLARRGYADGAIAQVISSQVINIALGLGLPLFVRSLATGKSTMASNGEAVQRIAVVVAISIVIYFTGMLIGGDGCKVWKQIAFSKWATRFEKLHGMVFGIAFAIMYIYCIVEGEMERV